VKRSNGVPNPAFLIFTGFDERAGLIPDPVPEGFTFLPKPPHQNE